MPALIYWSRLNPDLLIITYYDGYDPITVANGFIPLSNLGAITSEFITNYFDRVKGQITGTRVKVLDGNEHTATAKWLSSANYYDDHNRLIQNVKQTYPSGVEVTVNQYNFNGSVAETKTYQSLGNVKMDNQITYDHAGRLLSIGQTLTKDGVAKVEPLVSQEYNELGQLTHKKLSGGAQQLDNTYNIRGWLKTINNINSAASNARQFSLSLQYETSSMVNATPQFNGNISAMQWRTPGGTGSISSDIQGYTYTYDALNRMNTATYGQGANGSLNPNLYNESIGEYDLNGNILSLTRKKNGILVDDLSYSYDGNRQTSVNDATNNNEIFMERSQSGIEYVYDPNGNMITDRNKGIAIDYNILNLPKHIQGQDDSADYTYDASGNKLAQVAVHQTATQTTYYSGAFVYNGTALDFVLTGEGRAVYTNNAFTYEYFLKDHLGNTRVATAANGAVNTSSFYYPFGFTLKEINNQGVNKYLFGGKELQDVNLDGFALNLYDFGARFYDPALGRWTTPDPLCEKARRWSNYNYCMDNPLRFIDPDGMYVVGMGSHGREFDNPDRDPKPNKNYSTLEDAPSISYTFKRTDNSIITTKIFDSETVGTYTLSGNSKDLGRISDANAKSLSTSMDAAGDYDMTVTSSLETPKDRATTYYNYKLKDGKEFDKGYIGNGAALKVLNTFDNYGPQWNCNKSETIQAMTNTMMEVGPGNVTDHCNPNVYVIDIDKGSVSNWDKFDSALRGNPDIIANKLRTPVYQPTEGAFHTVFKNP